MVGFLAEKTCGPQKAANAQATPRALAADAQTATPGRLALCGLALTLTFAEYWLLNFSAFPLFDTVFVWAREISAVVGGLALALLALVSFWSTGKITPGLFTRGIPTAMALGAVCTAGGVAWASPALVALGASLLTVGCSLANVFVGMGCTTLGLRGGAAAISVAYAVAYGARPLIQEIAGVLPYADKALFLAIPLLSMLCMHPLATPLILRVAQAEPPAELSVTSPRSFLPFGHQVFLTLVIFRFIYGYTLTFGEVNRVPVVALGALAPLALLALLVCARRGKMGVDALFSLSILFSIAGFLLVALTREEQGGLPQVLLATGTGCFEVLMYYVLIGIGVKNALGALPTLFWGNAMASWGTILGALLGRVTNTANESAMGGICAAIILALVAYILFVLPHFSFAATLADVNPVPGVPGPEEHSDAALADLDRRCAALAAAGGLTDREREVLELLARGRNARFIEGALGISYSTTKTHVSHIYRKLGVHAHQELLDRLEK